MRARRHAARDARLGASAVLAVVLLLAAGRIPAEQRIMTLTQGTNIAIALFPDGESLVIDLLGRLWRLPASGGGAVQLTPDDEAAGQPRVGPDGRLIVYQRLVNGQRDLWLLDVDSGERRPLIESEHDEREPDFMPDGRAVVFASNEIGRFSLWRIDIETGVRTLLTAERGDASFPTVSKQGEIAYVRRDDAGWSLRALLPTGAIVGLLSSAHRLTAPSWRNGGGVLVFNEQRAGARGETESSELMMLVLSENPVVKTLTSGEDVFESRPAWASPGDYYYAADGQIWRRGIAHVTREPVHLFAAVTVESRTPAWIDRPLDAEGPNPVLGVAGRSRSQDGRVEVFAALGDLWLIDSRGGPRRLTNDPAVDIQPSVSPDGDFAVFMSDRTGFMDLWHVTLPGGILTQLTRSPAKAFGPAVSPDGRRVAFLETDGFESLSGARLRVLDIAARGSVPLTLAEGLIGSRGTRWDEPGRIAVTFRGQSGGQMPLLLDAVSGERVAGAEPALASTQTPAPVAAAPAPVQPLEWRAASPAEPYVVRVGRLFDGIRTRYRNQVDIHIDGQRIAAIVDRGQLPLPARVIDATDATVIPGLIDAHVHQSSILGERLGRIWLAHGVTTVREIADDVPAALERAESWASGRRLGPRLVVSPSSPAASDSESRTPLPTPVPVRSYSGMQVAAALFLPPGTVRHAWLDAEHAPIDGFFTRTSPLRLFYGDVIGAIVESRTVVASSLAAAGAAGAPAAVRRLVGHPNFQRAYTAAERSAWLEALTIDGAPLGLAAGPPGPESREGPGAQRGAQSPLQRSLVQLIRSGGMVAAGTEAPAIPYGLGVHLELALLVDAGIAPDQALRIATASNALALGLELQLGTLENGKLADFVVVDGDPLNDVSDALDIVAVVRGGAWLEHSALAGF